MTAVRQKAHNVLDLIPEDRMEQVLSIILTFKDNRSSEGEQEFRPNQETIEAMREAERIAKDPSIKGYHNINELFADLAN